MSERREEFERLADLWVEKSGHMSMTASATELPEYATIVSMGEQVIPWILERLPGKGTVHWLFVLSTITGENPIPAEHAGRVALMAQDWIEWGREQGYLS